MLRVSELFYRKKKLTSLKAELQSLKWFILLLYILVNPISFMKLYELNQRRHSFPK